ncbi:segregation and condensation protein A [Enterococcus sp. PF1-24]|uniref:segregation/condensation protein A n=1 Tax=unclassified Enterococcus TaxID=2608891 RepID=UPI0024731739|nr:MULTISPECIES: segregation/condensation protein A [unclassified Enterococcus]MDH6364930.1 segregation and condensation protein A [Enterococcus sp. PFB1-1]MDH6402031.1 segregation and condensation protein A [Enterococcus sp. PF1-24]
MDEIIVKLDVFEGPLDLLLHLIKKLEIDIYDIPIVEVTEQYMGYIHAMQTLELELAGDYLVMAATLMAIKSQMLLPKQELAFDEDEMIETGEDPRDALVAQLLEYRKFKYAAEVLSDRADERSLYYSKEAMDVSQYREEVAVKPEKQFNTIDLFLAFHNMLEKRKKKQPVETTITSEEISIEEKMDYIEQKLHKISGGQSFESFFSSYSKREVVTTFMALLELMKKGSIRVEQTDNYSPIMLYAGAKVEEAK